ncbi:MAG: PAS domain-containing protein [Rhodospirillales bacterium]
MTLCACPRVQEHLLVDIRPKNNIYRFYDVDQDHPPEQPNACILFDYWIKKRGARAYPSWKDIDLLDIWQIASCLIVKDVINDGADFLNRYWGTMLTQKAGFEGTGRTHLDLYKDHPEGPQLNTYQAVVNSRKPNRIYRTSSFITGREFVAFHSLNLPLGMTDEHVDHILIVIDYE